MGVERVILWVMLSVIQLTGGYSWLLPPEDKIILGLDSALVVKSRPVAKLSSMLCEAKVLKCEADVTKDIDLIAFTSFEKIADLTAQSKLVQPFHRPNDPQRMKALEQNKSWKEWMQKVGLGDHIPASFDVAKNTTEHPYPLVLKPVTKAGKGSFLFYDSISLDFATKSLGAEISGYFLEEAIVNSLSEVRMWGSAYSGKLLSLRCMMNSYDRDEHLQNSVRKDDRTLVPAFQGKAQSSQWIPCSRNVVDVAKQMMTAASYTGTWCSTMKMDADDRLKLVDFDAKFCDELSTSDGLLLAAIVPWAFAMGAAYPEAKVNHALKNGTLSRVFEHIRQHEERVLQTGGGFYKGKWMSVDEFDLDLRLDSIDNFYSRRHLQSRIVGAKTAAAKH